MRVTCKGEEVAGMHGACGSLRLYGIGLCGCVLVTWLVGLAGCGGAGAGSKESDAKERISQLFHLYKAYVERNKKGPPDEQALRDFGQKLTTEEKTGYIISEDIDQLFVSPRDKQKYVIRYNTRLDPTGPTRGVIWEAEGQGGRRYVALTLGYVEEYGEAMFKDYTK
jgi:hypothetical protein